MFGEAGNTLRRSLAFYFIPISIVPVIIISTYTIQVMQGNANQVLGKRAQDSHQVVLGHFGSIEQHAINSVEKLAKRGSFRSQVRSRNKTGLKGTLRQIKGATRRRVYKANGEFLVGFGKSKVQEIDYIAQDNLKKVIKEGSAHSYYLLPNGKGFALSARSVVKPSSGYPIGILEAEYIFGKEFLVGLKKSKGMDVALFDKKFKNVVGSFAVPKESLTAFSTLAVKKLDQKGDVDPYTTELGKERYATFLYSLPGEENGKKSGYMAIFVSMTKLDSDVAALKETTTYLAAGLVLFTLLLIFIFSKRLVKPIEILVDAMKGVKVGDVATIPEIESTVEIEYLVRSFNAMARSISKGKKTLESKLSELSNANEEIVQAQSTMVQNAKMASIGQIVAGVAHELNNPIGFIFSNMHHLTEYTERLKELLKTYEEIHPKLPPAEKKKIEKKMEELEIEYLIKDIEDLSKSCLEGAQRTKDIVSGLRTFSHLDEEAAFKSSDLIEGLRNTVKLLNTEFKDRISVHEEFDRIPEVECNASQINQVFMNLLSNAAQAIEGKGDIWLQAHAEENHVVIGIEDNGPGITEETMAKIFDPFFTTKDVGEGTGLGLSIAYGLVQKHQGNIEVDSEVGVGTRFTISLPIRQPQASVAS